jgi:signal transduction histidine kinase
VRLFYGPEQRRYSPFAENGRSEPVPHFRGEALFFDGVIAAVRRGGTWQVLTMPRSARVIEWERRQRINEATIAVVLIAAAFLFARQLARPLRRFAESADRVGRDTSAPPVPVQGPAELRVAATALNAMQRRIEDVMRERTEMIAAIAHDLRTPLARIAFRVETSAEAIREPVLDDIEQMREMIAEALDFSRAATIDTQHAGRCDLAEVVEGVSSQAREFGQEVAVHVPEPLPVNGDALALRRMVQNLVENALKYADNAEILGTRVNGVVTVEVNDRGPGLPEAMLERVIAPFVRNEPSRSRETGGVGLGLAISKAIAAKHGGDLVLLNRSEGGLTARITLPALAAEV